MKTAERSTADITFIIFFMFTVANNVYKEGRNNESRKKRFTISWKLTSPICVGTKMRNKCGEADDGDN